MPVVEEMEAATPAAPVRVTQERGHNHSVLAERAPIFDEHRTRQARLHDRDADRRFVEAMAPALSPEARQRAEAVRVGDLELPPA